MTLFEKCPQLHRALHWVSAAVSFLLIAPPEALARWMSFLPGDISTHRYAGYALALLTFSRALVKQEKAKAVDPAAPTVPASEAPTKVEKINPEKSR